MAVTFDAVGPSSAGASVAGASGPLNWTHTVGGGVTNGAILAFVNVDAASGTGLTVAVTCATVPMTPLHALTYTSDGFGGFIQAFYATGVTPGAKAMVATVSGGTPAFILGASLSFSGAGRFGTPVVKNTASSANIAVAANTSGNIIAGAIACGDGALTAMSGAGTLRSLDDVSTANNTGNMSLGTAPATGSSVTLTWTSPAGTMALVAVEVQPAGAAAPAAGSPALPGQVWLRRFHHHQQPPPLVAGTVTAPPPVGSPALPGQVWLRRFRHHQQPPVMLGPATAGVNISGTGAAVTAAGGAGATAETSPPLEISGFGTFPAIGSGDTVNWVTVAVRQFCSTGLMGAPVFQLWDGTTAQIGAAHRCPVSTSPGTDTATFTGVTYAQLATLRVRVYGAQGTAAPGAVLSVDSVQLTVSYTPAAVVPVITALAGGGTGYFADQHGNPVLVLGDEPWGLPTNAGRYNSGNWQADITAYMTSRAAQGFNVVYTTPIGHTIIGGINDDGRTYDGVLPFTGGDPGVLNNTFWARIDYLVDQAAAHGITIFMNCAYSYCIATGGALAGKTTTQWQNYGAALAARYAAKPNIMWVIADDYFGGYETIFTAWRTGLRGGGDTHAISIQNYSETTSRKSLDNATTMTWGASYTEFNCVYAYEVGYFGVEFAYLEASPVPVLWLDGYFYKSQGAGTYYGPDDRAMRQYAWHALSSGSRGKVNGAESIQLWDSGSPAAVTTDWWYANNAGNIRAAVEALPGWHLLIPDTSSQLVTAGRGTRATYTTTQYAQSTTNTWVTASRVPDGSLALIYLSHATTITIDQTQLGAGYTATWIDPVTGATSSATPGATYNSTAKGNNSAGDPDWVLALQGPPLGGPANITGVAAAITVAAPAGSVAEAGNVTGAAAAVTVAAPAGVAAGAGAANVTGIAAAVTVASPAGVFAGSANATGTGLAVTVAGGAGTAASTASVTGIAAHVTVASPAGVPSSGNVLTGIAAPVTVAAPAGAPSAAANVTGIAAPVTVQGAAGVAFGGTSGAANVNGVAAPVTVASPAGTLSADRNVTGTGALVTVAAPAGVPSGAVAVTGTAAPVMVASSAGTSSATASVPGTGAPVTAAAPAGVSSSSANLTGTGAAVTVTGGAGVPFGGTSGAANITGTAATVTAAAPAGVPHSGTALTGTAAPVTVAGGAGSANVPVNVTGVAAHVTAAAPAGTFTARAGIAGTAAPVLAAVTAAALSAAANTAGHAALITAASGAGTATSLMAATSTPTVTAPDTSTATVTDPRDGTPSVTAPATSAPSVS